MSAQCKACRTRKKDWQGGDPICSFAGGQYRGEAPPELDQGNWNCATLNKLRGLLDRYGDDPHDNSIQLRYCTDDQRYGTIDVTDALGATEDEVRRHWSSALYLSWYKDRGHTQQVWLMPTDSPPHRPTEKELRGIIAFYLRRRRKEKQARNRPRPERWTGSRG